MPRLSSFRAALYGLGLLRPVAAAAQTADVPPTRVHYWIVAGAGFSTAPNGEDPFAFFDTTTAVAAVASLQIRNLVFSARTAAAGVSSDYAWDAGLLAGLGTSLKLAMSGSVAAGLGRQDDWRGHSSVAVPVELQLTWRFAPWLGAGVYGFGSFAGKNDFVGATFMVRMGKLG